MDDHPVSMNLIPWLNKKRQALPVEIQRCLASVEEAMRALEADTQILRARKNRLRELLDGLTKPS